MGTHVTWLVPDARFIFARDKIEMHGRSWKSTARDYAVQSDSRNYLIYWRPTNFVSETTESWNLFFKNFLFHVVIDGHLKNIGV